MKFDFLNPDRINKTICAESTPVGRGAISIVRLSGIDAEKVIRKSCPFIPKKLSSHKAYYGNLMDVKINQVIDDVIVLFFKEGQSYTGQDTFEINLHGNPILVQKILNQFVNEGAVISERGEFTLRAYFNGRLDLVQAESVLSIINSRSEKATQLARYQLDGYLSRELEEIYSKLEKALAELEANIDFSTEDIDFLSHSDLKRVLNNIIEQLEGYVLSYERIKSELGEHRLLILGRTNAGKSSLFNSLCLKDRAIVTSTPGTTRDSLEAQICINGVEVIIIDSAGYRKTEEPIEKLGLSRALSYIEHSDIVLYVYDACDGWSLEDDDYLELIQSYQPKKIIFVANKSDLVECNKKRINEKNWVPFTLISSKTREGLNELLNQIGDLFDFEKTESNQMIIHARHYELIQQAQMSLATILGELSHDIPQEFVISDLNESRECIGKILGKTPDFDILDRIFSEFCIGK